MSLSFTVCLLIKLLHTYENTHTYAAAAVVLYSVPLPSSGGVKAFVSGLNEMTLVQSDTHIPSQRKQTEVLLIGSSVRRM